MHNVRNHRSSTTKISAKWLLLSLAFVWLVGCVGLTKSKAPRDPFASTKFSCGEDMPPSRTSAPLPHGRG